MNPCTQIWLSALSLSIFWNVLVIPWTPCSGETICGKLNTSIPAVAEKLHRYHPPGDPCIDIFGNIRDVGEEWSEDCDCNICYEGPIQNHTVTYGCREENPQDNPDPVNCAYVGDVTKDFPTCCPVLECAPGDPLPTVPACYDRADNNSCTFWAGENNEGCILGHEYFNFTFPFCRLTCG